MAFGAARGLCVVLAWLVACSEPEPESTARAASEPAGQEVPAVPVSFERTVLGDLGDDVVPPRPVELYVPDLPPPDGGFPFLVVTDGDLADTHHFRVYSTLRVLVDEGRVAPTVVVAVPSRLERDRELSSRSLAFVTYVADVVLPAARDEVPLASSGAMMGYSFGGLTAVVAGTFRPDAFSRVIAMSPSLWFRRRQILRDLPAAEEIAGRWWLDVGTLEGHPGETVPYMVADARQLRDDLLRRDLSFGVDVGYYEAPDSDHDMAEAGRRMRHALAFALGDERCEPLALTLYPYRDTVRVGQRAATAVELRCASGLELTVPGDDVDFQTSGAGIHAARDGVFRGRAPGVWTLRARRDGLAAEALVTVR